VQGSLSYPANRFPFGNNRGIHGTAGASGLVLRNVHTGNSRSTTSPNNQITGAALFSQVELDWQLDGGFAVDSPSGSIVAQLVQAMAGFGGSRGAADGLNAAPLGSYTSQ
jgi:hypothetical protein